MIYEKSLKIGKFKSIFCTPNNIKLLLQVLIIKLAPIFSLFDENFCAISSERDFAQAIIKYKKTPVMMNSLPK